MRAKSFGLKKFVVRYAWAGPVLGFVLGIILGPGSLWNLLDLRLKGHEVNIDNIRLEKEIYERQQSLLQQSADDIITYVHLRDSYFGSSLYDTNSDNESWSFEILAAGTAQNPTNMNAVSSAEKEIRDFEDLRIKFLQQKTKLVSLITEYNQLEAMISTVEVRQPVWFDLRVITLVRPSHINMSPMSSSAGVTNHLMTWICPPDPVCDEANNNLKEIFAAYGHPYSSQ